MTLTVKNLQGSCVYPYVRFCNSIAEIQAYAANVLTDFQPDLQARINALYARHASEGIPRWDRPGSDYTGGAGMELWAQRTCDSHSVMSPGLSVIEGIYGRNGNGFTVGPGPSGEPEDFMSNCIVFGTNPFLVDVIGAWLAGHEPGNFGLFHIARERGFLTTFNPAAIPVYSWETGGPALTPVSSFTRTPLVTNYLRRDYNGGSEDVYHLVNEPYTYTSTVHSSRNAAPRLSYLSSIRQAGSGTSALLTYSLPQSGNVRIDVFRASGELVDVVSNGWASAGTHMVSWHCTRRPAGMYYCRFWADGYSEVKNILVR
jgi:hypothetical protein